MFVLGITVLLLVLAPLLVVAAMLGAAVWTLALLLRELRSQPAQAASDASAREVAVVRSPA